VDLHDAMIPVAQDLLKIDFMDYIRGNVAPTPQNESHVTYAHKLEKSESEIDWSHSAQHIHNQIRGMALGPGTYTWRNGQKLKLMQTAVVPNERDGETFRPGQVVNATDDGILVQTGDQLLKLLMVQPESKPRMSVSDFLRGYRIGRGEKFGKP